MAFLDKIFSRKDTYVTNTSLVEEKEAVLLSKAAVSLDKTLVKLSKESKVSMVAHTAKVAVVTDYSGSMSERFSNGSVQKTITRLLPLAMKFDDDGELEPWLFSDGYEKLKPVTVNNYKGYVKRVMEKAVLSMGGTNYSPVLENIIKYYEGNSAIPAFVIFITDGDNSDREATNKVVKKLSEYNMFVQFVGIGNTGFKYLRSLDDMQGRKCDNTGFISVKDMNDMDDETLYTELLSQYRNWLNGNQ